MPSQIINEGLDSTDISLNHESVLKRLDEVASAEYPFPLPERLQPKNRNERVNLKSNKNLYPLLASMFNFTSKVTRPIFTIIFAILGYYLIGVASSIFYTLSVICFIPVLLDPFFMHYITDGRLGGLGKGGGSKEVKDGFFCSETPTNLRIRDKLSRFLNYSPTPYLYSGDLLTLGPFLMFKGSKGGRVPYKRYWVKVPAAPAPDGENGALLQPSGTDDDEAVALDIVFPQEGHRADKPTFLILHGLNGGSTEPYVLDLARRATKEGHTVAVMINRGLMKTPIKSDDTFHGARTSDVGCTVDVLLHALGGERRNNDGICSKSKIVLVGFSMGGIVAANYAAKAKEQSGLVGALSFSGTLCSEKFLLPCPAATHSLSIWQPAIAWGLKATIIKPGMPKFVRRGFTTRDVENCKTVVDIDTKLVCKYHGYPTVRDYYEDMSAGGSSNEEGIKRLQGVKIPLLTVHAIDDPIAIFEVALADKIEKTDNVMLLATKHGGHIGWPTGMFPSVNRWNFMIDLAMEYAELVCPE